VPRPLSLRFRRARASLIAASGLPAPVERDPARSGYLMLLITALGWSGAWVVARAAAHEASPFAITVGRFAVATFALLPAWFLLDRARGFRLRAGDLPLLMAMALSGVIGYTVLFLSGIARAPASDGAVITPALGGVFGMLLAWPALGAKPTRGEAFGATLAVAGAVLVGWGALQGARAGDERIDGDLLFVGAAVTWGVYSVLGKRAAQRIPAATGVLLASALGVALLLPVVLVFQGPGVFAGWRMLAWTNVLYLGLVATAVSFVAFYLGVQRVGVARTAPFYGLVPVFAVVEAAWLLGETLTPLHVVGGALVVAGIALPSVRAGLAARAQARAA
jgi:drug/metabolite transporter (DMT)-like permease